MEDTYVRLINCRLHLFRSSASSFTSQYLLLFFKSSTSSVPLLPIPFTSVISPSMASWRRQFLLRIWPIQLDFLRRILFISVLFSHIRSRTCSLVTFSDHFIFSILLQYHVSKLSKYFRSNSRENCSFNLFLKISRRWFHLLILQIFEWALTCMPVDRKN